jgi:hypothetical protein
MAAGQGQPGEAGARPRLLRPCLKCGCRLGPLPRKIEIDLATSRIDRQLGRLSALLGVLLICVLQFRRVVAVALIQLLQCRYHRRLLD